MTWVKICGMTNLDDALVAVEAGADAVGFVFYEKSPRNVSVERAREICEKLPGTVEKVGVFVDNSCDGIRSFVKDARLTVVQLHGRPSQESVWKDPRPARECVGVSKIIPTIWGDQLRNSNGRIPIGHRIHEKMFALLIDSRVNGQSGGTGTPFEWGSSQAMVQALSLSFPVIVAGGLTPSNATNAMNVLQPFGVDVSSGVESSPGKKDPDKVRAFVRAVREYDRRVG